jgi:hypothetical protein
MTERISIGSWSMVPPSGWKSAERDPIRSNADALPTSLDPAVQLVAEQARLMTDELTLEAERTRFGLPIAGVVLMAGGRSDATLDGLADASLVASKSLQPWVAEALTVVNRRWTYAAGEHALELELTLKAGLALRRHSKLASLALRIMGIDPLHSRVLMFDLGARRHLAAVIAGRRDFASASRAFDALIASSEFRAT